jgi:transcriptional regulator with XRE-family HTH domain
MVGSGGLRAARIAARLSQSQLAERANAEVERRTNRPGALDRNAISRLERGVITRPRRHTIEALSAVLGVAPADLGLEPPAPVRMALVKPWTVGPDALDALATSLAGLRRLEDRTCAAAVLPSVRGLVDVADVYASQAPQRVRPTSLTLASELHTYLGWLEIDTTQFDLAMRNFDRAVSLAFEADAPDELAHAFSFQGYLALRSGRFDRATSLSEVSQRDPRVFRALRVYDGYQEAWARALAGDTHAADRAMSTADRQLNDVPGSPMPEGAYWYSVPFLLTQRASVHEALGRLGEAVGDLETGLAEMDPDHLSADWTREIRDRLDTLRAQ